jgi:Basic region leucine zipper
MYTRKRALAESLGQTTHQNPSSVNVDSSTVEPSLLQLASPPASLASSLPNSPTPEPSDDGHQPKKQRIRRNAKTEEEKKARAEERALRNRRAAQESRDRRRKQFEHMESENKELMTENLLLKEKLATLESKLSLLEQAESDEILAVNDINSQGAEAEDGIATTHYPAVIMYQDQLCQAIPSLLHPSSTPSLISTYQANQTISHISLDPVQSTIRRKQSAAHSTNFWISTVQQPIFSPMTFLQIVQSEFYATFDGLNIGSPEKGAETTMHVSAKGVADNCGILDVILNQSGDLSLDLVKFELYRFNTVLRYGMDMYNQSNSLQHTFVLKVICDFDCLVPRDRYYHYYRYGVNSRLRYAWYHLINHALGAKTL